MWYCLTNDQLSGYLKKFMQNSLKFSNDNCFANERIILKIVKGLETFKHVVVPIAWREKIIRLWCFSMQPLMKQWCHGSLPIITS